MSMASTNNMSKQKTDTRSPSLLDSSMISTRVGNSRGRGANSPVIRATTEGEQTAAGHNTSNDFCDIPRRSERKIKQESIQLYEQQKRRPRPAPPSRSSRRNAKTPSENTNTRGHRAKSRSGLFDEKTSISETNGGTAIGSMEPKFDSEASGDGNMTTETEPGSSSKTSYDRRRNSRSRADPFLSIDMSQALSPESIFRPSRYEDFTNTCFGENIRSRMSKLQTAVTTYMSELNTIPYSSSYHPNATGKPLKYWRNMIDVSIEYKGGRAWYDVLLSGPLEPKIVSDSDRIIEEHSPISYVLRAMLCLPKGSMYTLGGEAQISREIHSNPLCMSFLHWFAMDIVRGNVDLLELPELRAAKAVLSAVRNVDDKKWSDQGGLFWTEIFLRTWAKDYFKTAIRGYEDLFTGVLESFIQPMTTIYEDVSTLKPFLHKIVSAAVEVWGYTTAISPFKVTYHVPRIGSQFNPELEEIFEWKRGTSNTENETPKIRWVVFQGIHYHMEEENPNAVVIIKAKVLVC